MVTGGTVPTVRSRTGGALVPAGHGDCKSLSEGLCLQSDLGQEEPWCLLPMVTGGTVPTVRTRTGGALVPAGHTAEPVGELCVQ